MSPSFPSHSTKSQTKLEKKRETPPVVTLESSEESSLEYEMPIR